MISFGIRNPKLLKEALTHRSYINENRLKDLKDNEELEFLGDAVLGLVISDYLYRRYPRYSCGELSKLKGIVVSEPILTRRARNLNVGKYLLLGKGEEQAGGRSRSSILSDALEAIIGALYLDRGLGAARHFILREFGEEINSLVREKYLQDYKGLLQEIIQGRFKRKPSYEGALRLPPLLKKRPNNKILPDSSGRLYYKVIGQRGPQHKKVFTIEARLGKKVIGKGRGKSKKEAEQRAAQQALSKIKNKK
ncbi:ribonuclease III [bacterium]|nr:ribonuclease III [bacterium]